MPWILGRRPSDEQYRTPSYRARCPAPLAGRDHDRLRRLGHAPALRLRARRAQRRADEGRALRPLPHGRDHRDRAAGGRAAELRPRRQHRVRGCRPRPLHHDLPGRRRHPGRPDRLPARADRVSGGRQRLQRQVVLDALTERAAGFDAEVRDDRDAYALIAVQGPESPGILASLTDADLDGLKYYAGLPGTVAGVPALIARTGYTGEDGFELFVKPEHAVELWQALTKAGEGVGLVPCGLSCRDTLRLEAGMPLYGHELSASLTPFDAGLGRVVKFEKEGDFVGRAALREAAENAHHEPPRVLVGLIAEGRRVPRAGYAVVAGGEVIGEVTSGAPSPTLGKPIAMAYVDPAHATPGAKGVGVDIRGSHEPYDVVALP